ncbi:MAG: hypothetical protein K9M15_02790 [Candidatus Marinimicrobia bacterium]|nr:hypothetical protein [Candidatus Neomarinimicrobiota bacterium]
MKNKKQYGFIEPVIEEDHFILGADNSLPRYVINPSGDWSEYVTFEPQRKQFETYNCTAFGTIKCVQILLNKLGEDSNFSDRFLGVCAGTKAGGNDPHTVAQAIRHNGLIPETMLPFSSDLQTIDEYYSFKGADENKCRKEGLKWLDRYSFGHEWVFNGKTDKAKMIDSLRYSPLGVSVCAWRKQGDLYVKWKNETDNHWTVAVVGYEKDKYWLIADSYLDDGEPIKKLAWDYPFQYCKRYNISKKLKQQLSFLEIMRKYLCNKNLFNCSKKQ